MAPRKPRPAAHARPRPAGARDVGQPKGLGAGLHLVHKPPGVTSQALLGSLVVPEGLAIGHGGTLDANARGLLLVLTGAATRLFEHLHAIPKGYVADVAWGRETDTGYPDGTTVALGDARGLTVEALEGALVGRTGWQPQAAPAVSAKRIDGERAWVRAARGETVEMEAVDVYVHEAKWVAHALPRKSTLFLSVRGGFYVRSFARDVGRGLGVPAHLTNLKRTQLGPWRDPGPGTITTITGRGLLPWLPSLTLDDAQWKHIVGGGTIEAGTPTPPESPVPQGFPGDTMRVRAFRGDKLVALLARTEDGRAWQATTRLGDGL